ncbi:MAG: chorismate synthase [Lachnospiraceae bacterium]|nr:chorismate synthase [Lachnospiraceae bacterium]
MSGSTIGKIFRVTTWGESHGPAIGAVVDGVPAGIPLDEAYIQKLLDRRRPGNSEFATARKESDTVHIMSGVFEGITTGTPVSLIIYNEDQRSADYSELRDKFRPGHADYTFQKKYGVRDYRGGGRSSGRETAARVAAGAVAEAFLDMLGISFLSFTRSIGSIFCDDSFFDEDFIYENDLYMPDRNAYEDAKLFLTGIRADADSVGGIMECRVRGVPAGIGETVFDKLDARLAQAVFSIGAVKGFEIGDGFGAAASRGSENNDAFLMNGGVVEKATNHSGGILGGMSDGSEIVMKAAVKPTPSIGKPQMTVTSGGEDTVISVKGRHDPVIVPRAVPVMEAMAAITLADLILEDLGADVREILKHFRKA